MNWDFFYKEDAPLVQAYSWQHIIYLCVCAAVIYLFIRNRNTIKEKRDKTARIFLWVLIFQQVVLLYCWYAIATGFDLSISLPLHICRVSSLLTIVFLLTKKMFLIDIVCYFSVFALISFFYPMNVYHFAHISGMSYMINHLVTVLIPIFAVVIYGWRPTWRSWRNAAIAFAVYFPMAMGANALTESGNYFYQTDRPFLRDMPQWQYSALSFIATLACFALAPLIYSFIMRKKK